MTSDVEFITPDRAMEWLQVYAYDRQRKLNWRRVHALAGALRRRAFRGGTITLAQLGRAWYLADGQHRLSAIMEAQIGAFFTVTRVVVATKAELAELYATFDPPGSARGVRDALNAHDVIQKTGLSAAQNSKVSGATVMLYTGFDQSSGQLYVPMLPDERVRHVEAWADIAGEYYSAISQAQQGLKRALENQGVMASGLLILRYEPERGRRFFRAVAENDGLVRGTAEHTLVTTFLLASGTKPPPHLTARYVALAWNAAYEDRRLSVLRIVNPSRPIAFRGTPFGGGQTLVFEPGSTEATPPGAQGSSGGEGGPA